MEGILQNEFGCAVDAVEVFKSPRYWPGDVPYFPTIGSVPADRAYDCVMELSTFYAMSDADIDSLMVQFARRVRPKGIVICAEQDARSVLQALKSVLAQLFIYPFRRGITMWGYVRGPGDYIRLLGRHMATSKNLSFRG